MMWNAPLFSSTPAPNTKNHWGMDSPPAERFVEQGLSFPNSCSCLQSSFQPGCLPFRLPFSSPSNTPPESCAAVAYPWLPDLSSVLQLLLKFCLLLSIFQSLFSSGALHPPPHTALCIEAVSLILNIQTCPCVISRLWSPEVIALHGICSKGWSAQRLTLEHLLKGFVINQLINPQKWWFNRQQIMFQSIPNQHMPLISG